METVNITKTALLTGRLDDLTAQLHDLVINTDALQTYGQSVDSIITNFSGVINQISYLGNAVLFVAGDDSGVASDLADAQGDQLLVKIYVTTAIYQVQTLQTDAA